MAMIERSSMPIEISSIIGRPVNGSPSTEVFRPEVKNEENPTHTTLSIRFSRLGTDPTEFAIDRILVWKGKFGNGNNQERYGKLSRRGRGSRSRSSRSKYNIEQCPLCDDQQCIHKSPAAGGITTINLSSQPLASKSSGLH